jgi:hypothetical protein
MDTRDGLIELYLYIMNSKKEREMGNTIQPLKPSRRLNGVLFFNGM